MKTYEDFLTFLDDHLKSMTDFIPASHKDFHAICFATGRFLLTEPYRWEELIEKWLTPPEVPKPGEKELMEFFNDTKGFKRSFKKELKEGDTETLHQAYQLFYGILSQKDEFLSSIFRDDVRACRFKKVFKQSKSKIKRTKVFILDHLKDEKFLELMRKFTKDLEGFSLTLINNKNLLDQAIKKIEER